MKEVAKRALPEKVEEIARIRTKIKDSKIMILADYRGMTVKEITELRRQLRKENAEFLVLKNTLTHIALQEIGLEGIQKFLTGPLAVVFGYKDQVSPAKVLIKFCSETEKPVVKGGSLAEKILEEADVKKLAKLPAREELIAKVVGGIKSPLYSLVMVTSGPLRKLVYALNAIKDSKQK
ncbi:MAG: 50S ribosomal protein L10 [Candidatus Saganbacteria bacterium]|nr:50S ribosomal protein L10 [Candidatus Saganbacteria bacterium]